MEEQLELPPEEDIIWRGYPQPHFSITMLENRAERPTITWGAGMFPFVLVAIAGNAILFLMNGMIWITIFIVLIGIVIIIRPEFKKAERKKHTAYYITDKGVFFKLWRAQKEVLEFIPYKSIQKVYPEVYKGGRGNIHLFLKKGETAFDTYDFKTCQVHYHPTLVMVEDAKNITSILKEKLAQK